MNYKFAVIVITLILVGSGIYYYQNNKKVSPQDIVKTEELTKNNLTVVYNNDGFLPKELRIKKGDKVKFINLSDRKMWVASNDHPAHTIYPEFDQKDIALRNGEYEFKFEKVGNWGYHNHNYASHTGNIIVE